MITIHNENVCGNRLAFRALYKIIHVKLTKLQYYRKLNFNKIQLLFPIIYQQMSQIFKELDQDQPREIQHLAPEKYGKAAYAHLTYTPSKLKDNLLYIEAVTLKKEEEKNSKLRQIITQNDFLQQRMDQLKRERQGIEDSLNQQIMMYKKFITELQGKYELKIKDMQGQFTQQMRIIIQNEEEKAKIVQAERQKYQEQIGQLKQKNDELQKKLAQALKHIKMLNDEREKLHLSQKQITFELEQVKELKKLHEGKKKDQYDELKNILHKTEETHKMNLHKAIAQKQSEIEAIKRKSLQDIGKLQQKIQSQNIIKNSQIQQLTKTFNSQVERLNAFLTQRQNTIQQLKKEISEEKQKVLEMTRAYDRQINSLIYQKNKNLNDLDSIKVHNVKLLEREKVLVAQPIQLTLQVTQLKQLLRQSSYELSKCKEELVNMDKQRIGLLTRLAQLGHQNEVLSRSRRDYLYRT